MSILSTNLITVSFRSNAYRDLMPKICKEFPSLVKMITSRQPQSFNTSTYKKFRVPCHFGIVT